MFPFKSKTEENGFQKALEKMNALYNPETGLIREKFSSPGYHTRLTGGYVHSTRTNAGYALALFDSGVPENMARGKEIALKLAALQDKNPDNDTYGIWSWYVDEPLSQMAPPDWNWADFMGKEFMVIARDYRGQFSPQEYQYLVDTIHHACNSIRRRNMHAGYTNISIMGTYVTYVSGEVFGFADILDYAQKRLHDHAEFNFKVGNFQEFNSPAYTMIAIEDLTRFHRDMKNQEDKAIVHDLLKMAWCTVLTHFHRQTGQWAGPHARCYSGFLPSATQAAIQIGTGGEISFMPEAEIENCVKVETARIGFTCPAQLLEEYRSYPQQTFSRDVFVCTEDSLAFGTTYIEKEFTVGSFYKSEMWNQRDNLIAYFGSREKPLMLKVQCLHDFYDYSCGQITTAQDKGTLISVMNFVTDRGDTHIGLDKIENGKIRAKDMRIRFKFMGDVSQITEYGCYDSSCFKLNTPEVAVDIQVPFAVFGKEAIRYEVTSIDAAEMKQHGPNTRVELLDVIAFDIVLYQGEEKEVSFCDMEQAAAAFQVSFRPADDKILKKPEAVQENGRITLRTMGEKEMIVYSALRPGETPTVLAQSGGGISGKSLDSLVHRY